MRTAPYTLSLDRRQIHDLPDADGQRLVCEAGSLRITLDHGPRDIVLEPGQAFTPARGQRALVYALEPSRLTVQGVPAPALVPAARAWQTRWHLRRRPAVA